MSEAIPFVVSSGELTIAGVTLVVHQLSDGRRVIDHEGIDALFAAIAQGPLSDEDADAIAKAMRA